MILERHLATDGAIGRLAIATHFDVSAHQVTTGNDTWIVVSDEHQRLELTLESAQRMCAVLKVLNAELASAAA